MARTYREPEKKSLWRASFALRGGMHLTVHLAPAHVQLRVMLSARQATLVGSGSDHGSGPISACEASRIASVTVAPARSPR
eukprot:1779045-Prymnesium_polylepis.2